MRVAALGLSVVAVLGFSAYARAHRDDYIDETFVYQTLDAGELEPELWAEARWGRGRPLSGQYTAAFEYGLVSHWMIDAAVQWLHDKRGLHFERFRGETRFRFAEEGAWPVDLAASAEYELETAMADKEHVVTPRLVLSRDLTPGLNTTLNLDLPVTISPELSVSFAYAIGIRYPAAGLLRVGVELKHRPAEYAGVLFPQLWLALPAETTVKLGLGIGFGRSAVPFAARLVVEMEL